jgi:hypothetical protein
VSILNVLNSQYMGVLYFGEPSSPGGAVIFDTGSNWLTISSTLCDSTCATKIYNPKNSTTNPDISPDTFTQ